MFHRLALASLFIILGACGADFDLGTIQEDVSLLRCSDDTDCERGLACVGDGERRYCSTGDACESSRECPENTLCRGEPRQCVAVERSREADARQCPLGSREGRVSCPEGFDSQVVSRDPHCETCELDAAYATRCRHAGLTPEECRRLLLSSIAEDEGRPDETTRRCRAAGYTASECRRLLHDDPHDWDAIFRRCRAAGYDAAECRELFVDPEDVDEHGDEDDLLRRCRAAGYDDTECRRLLHG
jgi:hypothetical protein